MVTFDDGYADFAELALPVLEQHGIASTVYVATGEIGAPGMLSWDQLGNVVERGVQLGGHTHSHPQLDLLPRPAVVRARGLQAAAGGPPRWSGQHLRLSAWLSQQTGSKGRDPDRQVRMYGTGLSAMITKQLVEDSDNRWRLLRRVPRGIAFTLHPRSSKNAARREDYPRLLIAAELVGMLLGPAAYFRRQLAEPLERNAYALALNAFLTASLGLGFWTLATRWYSPEEVGQNSALIPRW